MYQDYLNDIIKYYRIGETNGDIPQRLILPTPGSIKEECIRACEARFRKEDLRTLTAFFKVDNDQHAMLRAIHHCDRDRFRPLVNFLRGITNNTDDLNIELLAWLINFPNRPFRAEIYLKESREIENKIMREKTEVELSNVKDSKANNENLGNHETIGRSLTKMQITKSWIVSLVSLATTRQKIVSGIIGILLLASIGFYQVTREAQTDNIGSKSLKEDNGGSSFENFAVSFISPDRNSGSTYARCTGNSPCRACSNCNSCNWCNSGGTCSICAKTKKATTQKRQSQCEAMTQKGKQCSRTQQKDSKYCWQHVR